MSGSSSANHTPTSHDPSPSLHGENTTEAHDSRILLEPYGDTFTNQSKAASTMKAIFHSRFCGAYISWKKVPPHVKEMWWFEFKNRYRWDPSHGEAIKKAWEGRCRERMKDTLFRVRKANKKPVWMSNHIFKELQEEWGKEEYVKKCKQMSLNRTACNSGEGVGKHTGGSVSFPEHEERMKQQKGDSYEYHEVWDSLHTVHKDGPNKGQFIDHKAKKTRVSDVRQLLKMLVMKLTQHDDSLM